MTLIKVWQENRAMGRLSVGHIVLQCYIVLFPDDFSHAGGKIRLVICLFHLVPVRRNAGALFYFNLTCDIT